VSVFLHQSIYKGKPGPVDPRGNIDSDLQRTAAVYLVAVCSSGATVAALMGGVPVVVLGRKDVMVAMIFIEKVSMLLMLIKDHQLLLLLT